MSPRSCALCLMLILSLATHGWGDDWPQWMGTTRDGRYREAGIMDRIPDSGLKVLWRTPVATGYSGPAVADGRVFLTDYIVSSGTSTNNSNGRDALSGTERVHCFSATTGEEIWKHEYQRPYFLSFANGPRATPTVDGKHVYVLGAMGDLLCLTVETGAVVWRKQMAEDYHTEPPQWGYAAHPLVHGDLLYCLAGGKGSVVVALNKMTGTVVWEALTANEIGYCPPTIQRLGGKDQLIIWHSDALHALDPQSGAVSWTYPLEARYRMSIAAPQRSGNRLFASGIGEISAMIVIDESGKPESTAWTGKPKLGVYSGNSTAIFDGDVIYGSDCGSGTFIAVNAADGTRYWETYALTTGGERRAAHGTAFVVKHGDKFILFAETGDLIFAKLSPQKFEELGRMHVLEPTGECFGRAVVWSHPALANRCLFVRNDKELVCVSLAAGQ